MPIWLLFFCFKGSPKKVANDSYVTTFVDDKASLMFQMIAFPSPKLVSIFYIGSSNDSTPRMKEHENTGISTCSFDKVYSYMITCTVTLHNKTVYATGFYTATFSNILGNLSFPFEVKERIYDTTQVTAGKRKMFIIKKAHDDNFPQLLKCVCA